MCVFVCVCVCVNVCLFVCVCVCGLNKGWLDTMHSQPFQPSLQLFPFDQELRVGGAELDDASHVGTAIGFTGAVVHMTTTDLTEM